MNRPEYRLAVNAPVNIFAVDATTGFGYSCAGDIMKSLGFPLCSVLALLLLPLAVRSQDEVTIPKSRLQELERKEKELEKLKKGAEPALAPVPALPPPTAGTPVPFPQRQLRLPPSTNSPVTQPLRPLSALGQGDIVEATQLAAYYRQDAGTADRQFKKQKVLVRGEIAAFEKPMFRRNYRVLLLTGDREAAVVCDLLPPPNLSAVFTANHGSELIGMQGETRILLAKVGQRVVLQGTCKGLHDNSVLVAADSFKPAN